MNELSNEWLIFTTAFLKNFCWVWCTYNYLGLNLTHSSNPLNIHSCGDCSPILLKCIIYIEVYSQAIKFLFECRKYLEVGSTSHNSVCIIDLEYFLFWYRPIEMCLYQTSKENHSFSLANQLAGGRKLCTSLMRSHLYSNSYGTMYLCYWS